MRRALLSRLVCPRTHAPYDIDAVRVADDEVVEAFLVSRDERDVRPLVAGVAVLPLDLRTHMRRHGSVYKRTPVNDPRLARFLLGRAGSGHDRVAFDEVVGHYRDLADAPPDGYDTAPHPDDEALARLLGEALPGERSPLRGVVVGAGVGRAVFALARHAKTVLGIDRSIACVRRARNIAVTNEHFFLPAPKESGLKEIPLDLGSLVRDGADFAVADADALPLADASMDVVVVMGGDSKGPWDDPASVCREAMRVARPEGCVFWHERLDPCAAGKGIEPALREDAFRMGSRP